MGNADKAARETARFLDNLTEFIAGEEQHLDEIKDSLQTQGVDPEESLRQFRQALSEHAPTWREKAARARALLAASFETQKARVHRTRSEIEREIRDTVESMRVLGAPIEMGAYHRKFEEARDEDLESLLEDLHFQRALLLKQRDKADSNG
jgi:type I site-specific restriction endonuclease